MKKCATHEKRKYKEYGHNGLMRTTAKERCQKQKGEAAKAKELRACLNQYISQKHTRKCAR